MNTLYHNQISDFVGRVPNERSEEKPDNLVPQPSAGDNKYHSRGKAMKKLNFFTQTNPFSDLKTVLNHCPPTARR